MPTTTEEMWSKINSGKGDPQLFLDSTEYINIINMLGGVKPASTPATPLQVTKASFGTMKDSEGNPLPIGYNELVSAQAVSYTYIIY